MAQHAARVGEQLLPGQGDGFGAGVYHHVETDTQVVLGLSERGPQATTGAVSLHRFPDATAGGDGQPQPILLAGADERAQGR